MRILYVYPRQEPLIARHVAMLSENLRNSADISIATDAATFRQQISNEPPDILHIHGCRHNGFARCVAKARRLGVRVVFTPHRQIPANPHRSLSSLHLYAIISFGKFETSRLNAIGWTTRIEQIRNAVTTNTVSQQEMATRTFAVYQKVVDSDTISTMDHVSRQALAAILKVGILGDRQWVQNIPKSEHVDWRRLLVYAEQEGVRHLVDYGINLLGLSTPMIDTQHIEAYFPDSYVRPQSIKTIIGDYQGNQTDYLLRMVRQTYRQPLLLHLAELTGELYRDNVDDANLSKALDEAGLTTMAQRLMQVLSEQTLLDEGYMPLPPVDDRRTRQIRQQIANHLKI